jgi:hypothetical protein
MTQTREVATMAYPDRIERVTVTEDNIDMIREMVSSDDQRIEVTIGRTISTWPIYLGHGRWGQMTVYHDTGRAALDRGGGSIWGDWDEERVAMTTDDPVQVVGPDGHLRDIECVVCAAAGQVTEATRTVEMECPECGRVYTKDLCGACAAEVAHAPDGARWCDDCRRAASMR